MKLLFWVAKKAKYDPEVQPRPPILIHKLLTISGESDMNPGYVDRGSLQDSWTLWNPIEPVKDTRQGGAECPIQNQPAKRRIDQGRTKRVQVPSIDPSVISTDRPANLNKPGKPARQKITCDSKQKERVSAQEHSSAGS